MSAYHSVQGGGRRGERPKSRNGEERRRKGKGRINHMRRSIERKGEKQKGIVLFGVFFSPAASDAFSRLFHT